MLVIVPTGGVPVFVSKELLLSKPCCCLVLLLFLSLFSLLFWLCKVFFVCIAPEPNIFLFELVVVRCDVVRVRCCCCCRGWRSVCWWLYRGDVPACEQAEEEEGDTKEVEAMGGENAVERVWLSPVVERRQDGEGEDGDSSEGGDKEVGVQVQVEMREQEEEEDEEQEGNDALEEEEEEEGRGENGDA